MSSMGSPGSNGNDNGNTDPLSSIIASADSNDALTSGGTLFGEVTLPSKFLSAKNSIEIHKNKVQLTSNQSLPNVVGDRGNCLNNLINQQQQLGSQAAHIRSLFCPLGSKLDRGSDDYGARRSNSGQKSSKSVNWAPVLAGQTDKKQGAPAEPGLPLQSSTTVAAEDPQAMAEIPAAEARTLPLQGYHQHDHHIGTMLDERLDNDTSIIIAGSGQSDDDVKQFSSSDPEAPANLFQQQQQPPPLQTSGPALSQSRSQASIYADSFSTGLRGSDTTVTRRQTAEGATNLNPFGVVIGGGSATDTGNCPSPTLQPTSLSECNFMSSQTLDDNYRPSCLFLPPPAENYVYNAQVDLHSSEELIRYRDQYNQNYTVTNNRRDQYTGDSDDNMTTLKAKDNNLDNHNYDTDDDFGEPDPQAPVLTMVNPKELPVPDPEYVARIVSEELHPFIARKYKKDCRTWLWKSRAQREAALARQKSEQQQQSPPSQQQHQEKPLKDW